MNRDNMKSLNIGLLSIVMAYSALNGCGGDRADNINPQPPATPMTIKAVTNDNADVVLSWPAVSGADSYNIYYSTDPKLDIKNYAVGNSLTRYQGVVSWVPMCVIPDRPLIMTCS